MFHFHRWTRWEVTEKGDQIDQYGRVKGTYYVQARKCIKCGYIQHHREIV